MAIFYAYWRFIRDCTGVDSSRVNGYYAVAVNTGRDEEDFDMQMRQGDVFLQKVKAMPSGAIEVPPDDGDTVLAYGEVTGHKHRICHFMDTGALPARLFEVGDTRFLDVQEPTNLVHEEHATVALQPGIYKVSKFGIGTQREYSPEAIRSVAD